jgi:hypothetical protein
MAETRTSRFGLVQWGVGGDSPSRIDFDEAFLNLEQRAAYDDGVTYTVMPGVNLVQGRYVMFAPGGANRTLYRRNQAGTYDFAGGNTDPDPFYLRPYSGVSGGGPTRDTAGLILSHPDGASGPGASLSYDGSISAGGTLRVFDLNDAAAGNVIVGAGASLTADPAVTGRLHVRTRADGERGLVLRPHGTGAGSVLAVQTTAGSDVLTLDSTGRMQQRAAAGFGGASVPSDSMMAVAPSSGGGDGVTNGLVLYGLAAADTKTILRVLRQADDPAALMQLSRDGFTVGRLPWGSTSAAGVLALSGRQVMVRSSGYSGDTTLWRLTRADVTDPTNTGLDEWVVAHARQSSTVRVPTTVTQALNTGAVNLTLKRYTDLTQPFAEMHRMGAGETVEAVGRWDSEGRVLAGTRWAGAGVMRDARQPLVHRARITQLWDGAPNATLTTTFPVMQGRSATACDLIVEGRVQAEVGVGAYSDREDGQQWIVYFDISVNGGSFTFIGSVLMGGPSHRTGMRPINVQEADEVLLNVPAGATFQVRTRLVVATANAHINVQAQVVRVTESITFNYAE